MSWRRMGWIGLAGALLFTFARSSAAQTPVGPLYLAYISTFRPASADTCVGAPGTWVFCSGFEEGNKAIWDDYDGNADTENQIVSDPGHAAAAGNHVMRFRVPAGRGGADLVKVLPTTYDRLYTRWYIQYEPGFNFAAPNHGGGLHAGDRDYLGRSGIRPDGDDTFGVWVDYSTQSPHTPFFYTYYRGMYQDCTDPNGSCWGDSLPCIYDAGGTFCTNPAHRPAQPLVDLHGGQWYCIEMMVDAGTPSANGVGATGALALWVDGQPLGAWDQLWLRTTPSVKLSLLWLSLFHHDGAHSVAGVLYDDVVVSTERVGCLDTP